MRIRELLAVWGCHCAGSRSSLISEPMPGRASGARRRLAPVAVGLAGAVSLATAAAWVWAGRFEVEGDSMTPALLGGDRLLLVPPWFVRPGQVVVAADPRCPSRMLCKRVGGLREESVWLIGDNPGSSTDSRNFGPVPLASVRGVAVWRYAPRGREGRVTGLCPEI